MACLFHPSCLCHNDNGKHFTWKCRKLFISGSHQLSGLWCLSHVSCWTSRHIIGIFCQNSNLLWLSHQNSDQVCNSWKWYDSAIPASIQSCFDLFILSVQRWIFFTALLFHFAFFWEVCSSRIFHIFKNTDSSPLGPCVFNLSKH